MRREVKAAIKEGLARGEAPETLAAKYGVRVQSIRTWIERQANPVPSNPLPTPPLPGFFTSSPLDSALRAAGLGASSTGPVPSGAVPSQHDPLRPAPTVDAAGSPPRPIGERPPTPDELVAILEAVDLMVMRTIGATRFSRVRGKDLDQACKLPEQEKRALAYLAPFAADYTPQVMQYAKPAMAFLFVGVWGMSVAVRLKILADIERKLTAAEARTVTPETTP